MKTNLSSAILAALLPTTLSCLGQTGITQQPASKMVYVGSPASFSVTATGAPPVGYQWRLNDADLTGKNGNVLSFASVQFTNAGPYSVVVSNDSGAVTSQIAWLSVLPTNVVNLGDRELSFGELSSPVWEAARSDDVGILSGDGLTLVLASTAPGGSGGLDIWMTTRQTLNSPWSSPTNLGPTVNSPADENDPRLSRDGLSLYFDSTRPGGLGGYDIWVSTRNNRTGPFGAPVNLGQAINSSADDGDPRFRAIIVH